jgi:hypothetical protein
MTGLLQLLRDHASAVEADLQTRGVDIRDRWRPGAGRHPALTLRRINALVVRHPVPGGAVLTELYGRPFERRDHILDEIRRAVLALVTRQVPPPWHGRIPIDDDPDADGSPVDREAVWEAAKARRQAELDRLAERKE